MECRFHPEEKTVDKCILCYTPICNECLSICIDFNYEHLCPKCLRALGLCWDCTHDFVNYL